MIATNGLKHPFGGSLNFKILSKFIIAFKIESYE